MILENIGWYEQEVNEQFPYLVKYEFENKKRSIVFDLEHETYDLLGFNTMDIYLTSAVLNKAQELFRKVAI